MAIVLDTDTVEEGLRAELMAEAIVQTHAPSRIAFPDAGRAVHGRIEAWRLGSADLVSIRSAGYRGERTPRLIRVSPASSLLLVVSPTSTVQWTLDGDQQWIEPAHVYVVDLNQPFEVDWCGGEAFTLLVPLDSLGVSVETIRRAVGPLSVSPIQSLVASSIALMARSADALETDPAATELGEACIDLVRALLTSDAVRNGDGTRLPADILVLQIREYIDRHLADPDLSPGRIARAHHISLRYLYKLCADANFSLHQWIIDQRLQRVRRELISPQHQHRPIAVIAQQYGFRDASHFTRRFRVTFGMTPREWRQTAQGAKL
ncbi:MULTISPECIES: helix-turn-helix domain-containing protein [unclassified Nocardia]|uniref:helix-turn-helix domain-containing protein n=1 Tax=unclassified Nocardia TaxID=2637762 RepID=UPI001CE3DEDF|nr:MULTISPECIES: helix-turn-helix domain-containing protein [unclassified Nocardia]